MGPNKVIRLCALGKIRMSVYKIKLNRLSYLTIVGFVRNKLLTFSHPKTKLKKKDTSKQRQIYDRVLL